MKCKKCGFELKKTDRFCPNCGEKTKVICPNCNSELAMDTDICYFCGKPVIKNTGGVSAKESQENAAAVGSNGHDIYVQPKTEIKASNESINSDEEVKRKRTKIGFKGTLLLAFISFFLPFCTVSCGAQTIVSPSGYELTGDWGMTETQMETFELTIEDTMNEGIILILIIMIAAVVATKAKTVIGMTCLSGMATIFLLSFQFSDRWDGMKEVGGEVTFEFGYWMALITLFLTTIAFRWAPIVIKRLEEALVHGKNEVKQKQLRENMDSKLSVIILLVIVVAVITNWNYVKAWGKMFSVNNKASDLNDKYVTDQEKLNDESYNSGTYRGSAQGFGGKVEAIVVIKDSKIQSVELIGPNETPEIGGEALKKLTASFEKEGSANVDIISGCTMTSNAAIEAVQIALNQAEQDGQTTIEEEFNEDMVEGSDSGYILPESDSRYLTERDLQGLDQATLRLARNEIYARHGRAYETKDLNEYFSQQPWYHGYLSASEFDNSVLNDYERANVELIRSIENSMSEKESGSYKQPIIEERSNEDIVENPWLVTVKDIINTQWAMTPNEEYSFLVLGEEGDTEFDTVEVYIIETDNPENVLYHGWSRTITGTEMVDLYITVGFGRSDEFALIWQNYELIDYPRLEALENTTIEFEGDYHYYGMLN